MMLKTRDIGGSRDLVSGLPNSIIGHILSFLPTKEAASTSVLSRKWRYLFALVTNLDFDDSDYLDPRKGGKVPITVGNNIVMIYSGTKKASTVFMNFVDRVFALQGNSFVHMFSLKFHDEDYLFDPNCIFSWILNVLQRGVSDLSLHVKLSIKSLVPSKIFLSETLISLKLNFEHGSPRMDFEYVNLPKLKSLYIESVDFEKRGIGLTKLLSGCHMLEDLFLDYISRTVWDVVSVSVTTLKRLTSWWVACRENPKSVSFDTPNLVYLDFSDTLAEEYPKMNFDSLVESKIDIRMTDYQIWDTHGVSSNEKNAVDFMTGIRNVKILYLFAKTLEVLNYCCQEIPLFNNLTHLTIESKSNVGWESLPSLLKNSPNLETLVLLGLVHKGTFRCGDVCLCKPYDEYELEEEEEEEVEVTPTCLSSNPVKVLKIMKFGDICKDKKEKPIKQLKKHIEQVKHFLKTMPYLEELILYYETSFKEDVIEVSTQLQRISRVASSKCTLQLISDHLNLSLTLPSSVSMKWDSRP